MKPWAWPLPKERNRCRFSAGVFGGELLSSFFRLKFSGVASSGAESTSRSDSGELGGPVRAGDRLAVRLNSPATLGLGLLGEPDSEPVS